MPEALLPLNVNTAMGQTFPPQVVLSSGPGNLGPMTKRAAQVLCLPLLPAQLSEC